MLFKAGKLGESLAEVQAAAKLDPKRYEAPATAALILHAAGKPAEARGALDAALKLAPADKQESLQDIAKLLASAPATGASPTNSTITAARRQYETLVLIIEEADKATLDAERKKLLREFMAKSAEFLQSDPLQTNLWVLRAVAAMELEAQRSGWLAGRHLKTLGLAESDNPRIAKIMAMLERKGWSGEKIPLDSSRLKWSGDELTAAAQNGDEEAQDILAFYYFSGLYQL